MKKKFNVSFIISIPERNNILSSFEEAHEEDVRDIIEDILYDVDDFKLENLVVKEKS
jgi:hypothetical protein